MISPAPEHDDNDSLAQHRRLSDSDVDGTAACPHQKIDVGDAVNFATSGVWDPATVFGDGALGRVVDFFFTSLLQPDDDLLAMMRKLVMLLGLFTGFFCSVATSTYFGSLIGKGDASPGNFTVIAVGLLGGIVWIGAYAYTRATKATPTWLLEVWLAAVCVFLLGGTIAVPKFPGAMGALGFTVATLLIDTPLKLVWLVAAVGIFVVHSYNNAYLGVAGATLATVPEPHVGGAGEDLALYGLSLVIAAFVGLAVFGMARQYRKLAAQLGSSAQVSAEVAELLRQYDTDGVRARLQAYRADPLCDEKVADTFTGLVENLDSYRPHLPNWMFHNESDLEDARSPGSPRSGVSVSSRHSRAPSAAGSATSTSNAPGTVPEVSLPLGHCVSQTFTKAELVHSGSLGGRVQRRRVVALVYIEFDVLAEADTDEARVDADRLFVERVHAAAKSFSGAVHSFIGNQLVVSFGAVGGTSLRPSGSALKFMLAVRHDIHARGIGRVSGACFEGPARARIAHGTGHAAVIVECEWRGALHTLFACARRHQTLLAAGVDAGNIELELREVGAIPTAAVPAPNDSHFASAPPWDRPPTVMVLEVVRERKVDDDEWMYVMQRLAEAASKGATAGTATADATRACLDGRFAEAIAQLEGASDDPMAIHLRACAERCLATNANFAATWAA